VAWFSYTSDASTDDETFDAGDITLHRCVEFVWEIPRDEAAGMRVPARVLASPALLEEIRDDKTSSSSGTRPTSRASRSTPSACPTVTRGTASPSATSKDS
jgi:hypothetical protein